MTTNTVPQGLFGPGILFLTRTDILNGTPTNVGYVNEFSTDLTFETKPLYGQNQFPLLVARGTAKCTGKIKAATMSGAALNSILLGGTWTANTQYDLTSSIATAIPATPFTITASTSNTATTVIIPNTGTWNSDLGVVNAATLEPLTQ